MSITVSYGYDNFGRINDIDAGSGYIHFSYDYVDKENNIEKKYFHHRGVYVYNTYSYDDIDRLTGVTYHDSDTEGFKMDDLGNRSGDQTLRDDGTVNFAVDTVTNRYASVGGNNLTYDDAGNLATDKDGYQFTYDYENRMTEIKNVNDVLVAEFDYDTQGRRIRVYDAVADSTTLYYYSDNWQVLAEYDGANSLQAYYVFGNYIDEALLMHRDSADKYYLHDHLYSPVALTDSSGAVVERYEYDAYGKATVWNAGLTASYSASQYGNPFLFTGREVNHFNNGSLKLPYHRRRYLSHDMGCWYTPDPMGYIDGLNLYNAMLSNPLNGKDPMGTLVCSPYKNQKRFRDAIKIYQRQTACGYCGPDVTNAFRRSVSDLRRNLVEYFEKNEGAKERVCGFNGIYHPYGWDFRGAYTEFYQTIENRENKIYPTGQCGDTLKLNGKCYNRWEINYYLWGFVNRLCGNSRIVTLEYADKWSRLRDLELGEKTLTQCKFAFAQAGYEGITGLARIPSYCVYKKCKLDVANYEADEDFDPCVRGYNADECK